MSFWLIILIVAVGTIPFIVIAILVEAMAGNDDQPRRERRKRKRDDGPVVPFDFDDFG